MAPPVDPYPEPDITENVKDSYGLGSDQKGKGNHGRTRSASSGLGLDQDLSYESKATIFSSGLSDNKSDLDSDNMSNEIGEDEVEVPVLELKIKSQKNKVRGGN